MVTGRTNSKQLRSYLSAKLSRNFHERQTFTSAKRRESNVKCVNFPGQCVQAGAGKPLLVCDALTDA